MENAAQASRSTLTTATQLAAAGLIDPADRSAIDAVLGHFSAAITPQIQDLIEPENREDPLAAQFVPSPDELNFADEELLDPIGDAIHAKVPGIIHRYPDRVLLQPVTVCPVYCRFCFRRESVGAQSAGLTDQELDRALGYIEEHPLIWEVVLSGGDPLILSPRRLQSIMRRLALIPHLGVVRFHTRVPVVAPERIDTALLAALDIEKAVFVVLHTNHVRELGPAARGACARIIKSGIPMLSQTVLLQGVNANSISLKDLFKQLVSMRIKPYYLHHADLARGTGHFRTSVGEGQSIMRDLRGRISGLCQPTYVLDIPGGHGKVPIGPPYVTDQGAGQYSVRDFEGAEHAYADSPTAANAQVFKTQSTLLIRSAWLVALAAASLLVEPHGALAAAAQSQHTTLLFNAHVFTADPAMPYANAVAIRDERILAVGALEAVEQAAGADTRRVDLGGKFLMPGMIDAHAHPIGSKLILGGGFVLVMARFSATEYSLADLVAFVGKTLDSGASRLGDTVIVNDIDIGYWAHAAEIDAALSSGRFAGVPVVLIGSDGHTAWANRKARVRAGITAEYLRKLSKAHAIYYGFGAGFAPNGFVVDVGLTRLRLSLPAASPALNLAIGEAAVHYMNGLGITGWLDAGVAGVVGGDRPLTVDDPGCLPIYRQLAERGELTAHVAAYPIIRPDGGIQQIAVVESLRRQYSDIPNLVLPGLKVFADGVVEYPSQTAALSLPYRNTGHSTPLLFDPKRFNDLVVEADRRGLIVHIHAIGNLAVKASLDALGAARRANPTGVLPHTITHAQFVDSADVPRFAQYNVIAALQLLWAVADPSTEEDVKPYIDPTIYARMYPARSMLETGASIAGASDWPVTSANPFEAIYQAETRVGPQGVLNAAERMPREAMLLAYTRNSARVLNQLEDLGSIAPGKKADLVLVDRDVLTAPVDEVKDAKVLWTMFAGKIVFGSAAAAGL